MLPADRVAELRNLIRHHEERYFVLQDPEVSTRTPHWLTSILRLPWRPDLFSFGPKLFGSLAVSNLFGVLMFALLAASLFYFARKKLD